MMSSNLQLRLLVVFTRHFILVYHYLFISYHCKYFIFLNMFPIMLNLKNLSTSLKQFSFMQWYCIQAYIQKFNERWGTLSNCNQNLPLHFFRYKQVYVIKDNPQFPSLATRAVVDTRFFIHYSTNQTRALKIWSKMHVRLCSYLWYRKMLVYHICFK